MAHLVRQYQGLRVMRVDPWECLVFFFYSSQPTVLRRHKREWTCVAEKFGGEMPCQQTEGRAFPKPEDRFDNRLGLLRIVSVP